ncbi:hypothetical protein G5V59_19720 [Nocardioides sp. W3-2-3]|uniref:hypothetical protein n=1 Tax=Nocardioides convexus TaxID=2712224 RepID=UPI0024183C69|nr:hypothetical protein [Nocardioides convexus]NHA01320.1 hypothetical protein [Nocardioides convexus]
MKGRYPAISRAYRGHRQRCGSALVEHLRALPAVCAPEPADRAGRRRRSTRRRSSTPPGSRRPSGRTTPCALHRAERVAARPAPPRPRASYRRAG